MSEAKLNLRRDGLLECPKRNEDGSCQVVITISELGPDEATKPNETACTKCIETAFPQELNCVTLGMSISSRMKAEIDYHDLDKQLRDYCFPTTNYAPVEGPGTELLKIIPGFFKKMKKCGCYAYAGMMNRWGIEGCERHFDGIVRHLVEQSTKIRIVKLFPNINKKVAEGWTRQAIDNAREVQRKANEEAECRREKCLRTDWFVAITTAPRKKPTLYACIESLRTAGWEPAVFAEPDSAKSNCHTITHSKRHGIWHNWLSSCRWAIERTDAKYIMTVQDDIIFHPDSKILTDRLIQEHPEYLNGFLSLYTPKHYTIIKNIWKDVGVRRVVTKSLWGACALVWKRDVLEHVLKHPLVTKWLGANVRTKSAQKRIFERRKADPSLVANSDTAIGKILNSDKRPMYFVDPSPAQHIASHSTIGHGGNRGRRNCIRCADFDIPLHEQVFPRK